MVDARVFVLLEGGEILLAYIDHCEGCACAGAHCAKLRFRGEEINLKGVLWVRWQDNYAALSCRAKGLISKFATRLPRNMHVISSI